ncbi:uncharacterized protein NDAI_0D00470 [Naumovozyma dairenensis CBS 421]|uniref:Uncharacterized protein n=1 Tax=Naumovozyma dairenensis (strain ATCC 10597 / BCRC 20456 / CBS 421 / NBRC 0211 / NRRL Y-12639) TaxID=1071378 RepID=G0W9A0_NAUDC|nr:hypothetical protein NDAI_0D00470 [Naumovozyma dairenensis CBS 421]CCD24361.1 hypothetical protein NDAI_0D00470 [Naumovozyma dairenensis CBS 421]
MAQVITHSIFNYNKDVLEDNDKSMWEHPTDRAAELPYKKIRITAFRYEIIEVSDGNTNKMRGMAFFEKLKNGHNSTRVFLVPSFYHDLYSDCLSPMPIAGHFLFRDQYFRVAKVYFMKVGTDVVISLESGVFDTAVVNMLVQDLAAGHLFHPGSDWYLRQSLRRFTLSLDTTIKEWENVYHPPAKKLTCQDVREEISKLIDIEGLLNLAPKILSEDITIAGGFSEQESEERRKRLHRVIIPAKQRTYDVKIILFCRIYPELPRKLFAGLVGLMQTFMKVLSPVLSTLSQLNTISTPAKIIVLLMALTVSNVWITYIPPVALTDAVSITHEMVWHPLKILLGSFGWLFSRFH